MQWQCENLGAHIKQNKSQRESYCTSTRLTMTRNCKTVHNAMQWQCEKLWKSNRLIIAWWNCFSTAAAAATTTTASNNKKLRAAYFCLLSTRFLCCVDCSVGSVQVPLVGATSSERRGDTSKCVACAVDPEDTV